MTRLRTLNQTNTWKLFPCASSVGPMLKPCDSHFYEPCWFSWKSRWPDGWQLIPVGERSSLGAAKKFRLKNSDRAPIRLLTPSECQGQGSATARYLLLSLPGSYWKGLHCSPDNGATWKLQPRNDVKQEWTWCRWCRGEQCEPGGGSCIKEFAKRKGNQGNEQSSSWHQCQWRRQLPSRGTSIRSKERLQLWGKRILGFKWWAFHTAMCINCWKGPISTHGVSSANSDSWPWVRKRWSKVRNLANNLPLNLQLLYFLGGFLSTSLALCWSLFRLLPRAPEKLLSIR